MELKHEKGTDIIDGEEKYVSWRKCIFRKLLNLLKLLPTLCIKWQVDFNIKSKFKLVYKIKTFVYYTFNKKILEEN